MFGLAGQPVASSTRSRSRHTGAIATTATLVAALTACAAPSPATPSQPPAAETEPRHGGRLKSAPATKKKS